MRVGFSPSSSSNSDSTSALAGRGSTPLMSPQPLMPWLVSILTYTTGPTQYVFSAVMRMLDERSIVWAPGVWSAADTARLSSVMPAAAMPRLRKA